MAKKTFPKTKAKKARSRFSKFARKKPVAKSTIARVVKSVMRSEAEKKQYQTSAFNQQCAAPMSILEVNGIPFNPSQGTGQANRIGNRVKLLRVEVRGHVNAVANTQGGSNVYLNLARIILGRPREGLTVSAAQVNSIMQSGNSTSALGPDIVSWYRPYNFDTWNIYRSKNFKIAPASLSTTSFNNDYKNLGFFKFVMHPNMEVTFNDATNTPTNYNIFIGGAAIDSQGSAATYSSSVEFHYEAVFTFIDI